MEITREISKEKRGPWEKMSVDFIFYMESQVGSKAVAQHWTAIKKFFVTNKHVQHAESFYKTVLTMARTQVAVEKYLSYFTATMKNASVIRNGKGISNFNTWWALNKKTYKVEKVKRIDIMEQALLFKNQGNMLKSIRSVIQRHRLVTKIETMILEQIELAMLERTKTVTRLRQISSTNWDNVPEQLQNEYLEWEERYITQKNVMPSTKETEEQQDIIRKKHLGPTLTEIRKRQQEDHQFFRDYDAILYREWWQKYEKEINEFGTGKLKEDHPNYNLYSMYTKSQLKEGIILSQYSNAPTIRPLGRNESTFSETAFGTSTQLFTPQSPVKSPAHKRTRRHDEREIERPEETNEPLEEQDESEGEQSKQKN
jgi:hypothetical protein